MANSIRTAEAIRLATAFQNAGGLMDPSPAHWDVRRGVLANQLLDRVQHGVLPAQREANLCGPAAFMYCLLQDRPDIYVQFTVDLWNTGKGSLGNLEIEPSQRLRGNTTAAVTISKLDAVDWITLGSLRGYDGRFDDPTAAVSAATFPRDIHAWFSAVGAKNLFDNTSLTRFFGSKDWDDLLKVSCYVTNAWVLLLVNANILERQNGGGGFFPDHWVVATSTVMVNGKNAPSLLPAYNDRGCVNPPSATPPNASWPIALEVFSWGNPHTRLINFPRTSVKDFIDGYHGALVFAPIA